MTASRLLQLMMAVGVVMVMSCACGGGTGRSSASGQQSGAASADQAKTASGPVRYTYVVKNSYPHNPVSFTQGLYWSDGYLWEGAGEYRRSELMQVDLGTGKTVRSVKPGPEYFGEGIALLGGKIYQLTWLEGEALVYDAATLKQTGKFTYPGEGWGLTTDGRKLYMSDGSHEIRVLDPDDFSRERTIKVSLGKRRMVNINELEWIDGRIWANIYMTDTIVIIDPESGEVEGVVDLGGLLPESERLPDTDVLNGIAYDSETGRIFVTGKNWPKLYEIEIREKDE